MRNDKNNNGSSEPAAAHTSRKYDSELQELRDQVIAMGELAGKQCRRALDALVEGDDALARKVVKSDQKLDGFELDISARCTDIIARRQPTARDLRMVLATIRIASNLERVGDEAAKVGRLTRKLDGEQSKLYPNREPLHLGEASIEMLSQALDAFARLDVQTALAVIAGSQDLDREFKTLTRVIVSHMLEKPKRVKSMLRVNTCARAFERIGDHAVSLSEEVIYIVVGSDVRHLSPEAIGDRLKG